MIVLERRNVALLRKSTISNINMGLCLYNTRQVGHESSNQIKNSFTTNHCYSLIEKFHTFSADHSNSLYEVPNSLEKIQQLDSLLVLKSFTVTHIACRPKFDAVSHLSISKVLKNWVCGKMTKGRTKYREIRAEKAESVVI